jgi:acyl carrier protein
VENGELFIPLFYEEFYAVEPLQTGCFASVDLSSVRKRNDVTTLDIVFYNQAGKQVALLKGFTSKKVRQEGDLDPTLKRGQPTAAAASGPLPASSGDLEAKLRGIVARQLNTRPEEINLDTVFFEIGLQSAQLMHVVKEIETLFDLRLSPTLLFETNNLRELIAYLAPKVKATQTPKVKAETKAEAKAASPEAYAFHGHEPYLQDHLVFGKPALMGVTHPSLALEAFVKSHSYPVELNRIEFVGGPITLEATETAHIGVHFREEGGETHFTTDYYVNDPSDRKVCCRGTAAGSATPAADRFDLAAMLQQVKPLDRQTVAGWYELVQGFQIGPMLRTIEAAYLVDDSTLLMKVDLRGKLQKGNVARLAFDPLLFNTCYMVFHRIDPSRLGNIFIPLVVERLTVYRPMTESVYVVNTIRTMKDGFVSFDAVVFTEQGERIAEVYNASVKEVVNPSLLANASFDDKKPRADAPGALDVAIVGMSGRYPQSYDVNAFWDNLRQGRDCITEIPQDRWNWRDYYAEDRAQPGSVYSKWGGFIQDHDRFDPVFFNIAPGTPS